MSDYIIEARQVAKTLGRGAREVQALRGIDLSLRLGELTLLMGPSGSGKTTLLLILGCMLAPSSGNPEGCLPRTHPNHGDSTMKAHTRHMTIAALGALVLLALATVAARMV